MPLWTEILINVIGYSGFVAVASRGNAHGEQSPKT